MEANHSSSFHMHTKTWIENDHKDLLFGKGKTDILEQIDQEGSIAKAAEKMVSITPLPWINNKISKNSFFLK